MFEKLAISLMAILLMTGVAHAEHKLLITDVLNTGQYEASAGFAYEKSTYDFTRNFPGYQSGRRTAEEVASLYSLGIGVADGLQLRVRLPYIFQDRRTYDYISPSYPSRTYERDGWGDLELGARYRWFGSEEKPLTLVTGFNVKLDTADKSREGTGTTNLSPYVAIGSTVSNGALRPYASYQAIFRNHGANDSHLLTLGTEYIINKNLSLDPSVGATFRTESSTLSPYESYSLSLSCFIQVMRNFYLIPSAGAGISTASHTRDGALSNDTLNFFNAGLTLYYFHN